MGSTCHGHGFFLLEWSMANTDNISGDLHLQPDQHCFVFLSKFRQQKIQLYFCSREQSNTHTKILSLSLFLLHAAIILNSLGYQQHMTVLFNTVCPYEAFSGSPDDSYCQRQISTVDTMHIQSPFDLKAAARGGNLLILRLVLLLEGKVQYSVLTEKTEQYVSTIRGLQHVHEKMYGTISMSKQEPSVKSTKCLCLFCIYRPNHAIIAGQSVPQRNVSLLLCVGITKMLMLHKLGKCDNFFLIIPCLNSNRLYASKT
jgi:hypothetical protein